MGYDIIEFANSWLRENEVRKIYAIKNHDPLEAPSLGVETDDTAVIVTISTHEQTKKDLDRELSLNVESVRAIRATLEYFDEIWNEINEYISKPIVNEEEQVQ